jgi:hypothetical protein
MYNIFSKQETPEFEYYNPIVNKPYTNNTRPPPPKNKFQGFETKKQINDPQARVEDFNYLKSKGFTTKQPSLFTRVRASTGKFFSGVGSKLSGFYRSLRNFFKFGGKIRKSNKVKRLTRKHKK